MGQNQYEKNKVVVGFRNTLLQLWDVND